jgi:SAM-dependent methyltransferase
VSASINVPAAIAERLRCPRCRGVLAAASGSAALHCGGCASQYPVVNGAPILIDSERSVFTADAIIADYDRERRQLPRGVLGRLVWAIASRTPHVTSHRRQEQVARLFADRLARERPAPSILVVGSGTEGIGIAALRAIPGATICEFDVYLTDGRMLVADLLDLPFEDGSFDAVVAQGVLEHVIDPHRAAEEIHRVLKPAGLVFSTTPFVLGVHLPVADYTRFSRLAVIRLFRRFTPVDCDVIEGAAVTLAYSLAYFFMALLSSSGWSGGAKIAKYAGNYPIFWLRHLDALVRRSPVSIDAAASYYYIGRRSDATLADRDIVGMFRGVGLCPW